MNHHQIVKYIKKKNHIDKATNKSIVPLSSEIKNNKFYIANYDLSYLANKYGTPLFILDELTLKQACYEFLSTLKKHYKGQYKAFYASKAFSAPKLLSYIHSQGFNIEIVSGGELYLAQKANISGNNILFHGNNKSEKEMLEAVLYNVTIVLENEHELHLLEKIILDNDITTNVNVLIRITPNINTHTHEHIQTGHLESKFGFNSSEIIDIVKKIKQSNKINLIGIHAHLGSQIFTTDSYEKLVNILGNWYKIILELGVNLNSINIGGGLGVCYIEEDNPISIMTWVENISLALNDYCDKHNLAYPELHIEPGRALIATAVSTLYTCGSTKIIYNEDNTIKKNFVAVDGGMSDNPRPIMYNAKYSCLITNKIDDSMTQQYDIVGKHCESGDYLIKGIELPPIESGDHLLIFCTGAYNYSMSSNYNQIIKPAGVWLSENTENLFIKRQIYEDLLTPYI